MTWEEDPVDAYSKIAPEFARLSAERQAYILGIERIITLAIPAGSNSLLDVGAGEGSRALRIAKAANIQNVALLEPARGMIPVHHLSIRAEQLDQLEAETDVILCLWNVLGHIFPERARYELFHQFARLISQKGRIFLDVSHRYNATHYGFLKTTARFLGDQVVRATGRGDTKVTWQSASGPVSTRGHVFREAEIRKLARSAGLEIEARHAVDYRTGERRAWSAFGHLLFVMHRRTGE